MWRNGNREGIPVSHEQFAPRAVLRTAFFTRDFFTEYCLLESDYGRSEIGVKIGMSLGDVACLLRGSRFVR